MYNLCPKKEMFTSRFEETRGGRVPQKSKIWGDVVYGWSLRKTFKQMRWGAMSDFSLAFDPLLIAKLVHKVGVMFWKLLNL